MTVTGSWRIEDVSLSVPFTIARGTTHSVSLPVVELTDDQGRTGFGAAGPSRYYGETAETVAAFLPDLLEVLEGVADPFAREIVADELKTVAPRNPAARAAVDIALHDLVAKRADRSLARMLGIGTETPIRSSYTIGIDDPEAMGLRAADAVAAGHDILKVKLGGDADADSITSVREAAPSASIRVDANGAWTRPEALRMIGICADHDVEFVEQPVPADDHGALLAVYRRSPLPIVADETAVVPSDVPRVADRCDIINIKLMKCGGIVPARRMIHVAKAHGRAVMLGCMVESAASIAAAAHLAPLVEYADLDGALLLADDPFTGSPVEAGPIALFPDRPGTGVRPRG